MTKIIPVSDAAIGEAVEVIKAGGVIAHATETCYGLACDLTNIDAVKKLFAAKNRPLDQPVSALFASVEAAKQWVEWNEKAEELSVHLPGPLTIILPLQSGRQLATSVQGDSDTVGVRVSSHPVAQKLAELCGMPISTTSANVHGEPNPYSVKEIVEQGVEVDLVLDSGILQKSASSTVVDLSEESIEILRSGDLKL